MIVLAGIGLILLAVLVTLFAVFPSRARIPAERRRPYASESDTGLARTTNALAGWLTDVLNRRGWSAGLVSSLELAGVRRSPSEFVILIGSASLLAVLIGVLLNGLLLGLVLCVLTPLGARFYLSFRTSRRRKAFANQLDETLQLLSGGLRAGHSLLRAIDAVSREAESPTSDEFVRIMNETRLGRDLNDALESSAQRMQSEDFNWVAQAIAIHREVGGDLSNVLDEVGHTIRERGQIRRQVAALSAEGKMSAYILLALPFVVLGILLLTSTSYVLKFLEWPLGIILMVVAIIMMIIGTVWLSKVVKIKF
jgi:tight adherence protein B